ncbi:hypothetical protein ADK96_07490 [Streptomyces sp. IGB124]|nr:hypothetical protein [Streptomyces sp. IGB124]KOU70489.1 hypothetical protein ADK96_07490 [Streptomyces sp. IGB124]
MLNAMAGTPCSSAATAPPTVPEWVASPATFGPKLVPETTRSGAFPANTSASPKATESPGVPSTAQTFGSGCFTVTAGAFDIFVPVPLWLVSGATIVTSCPAAVSRSKALRMPGAS